jgi:two-component system CheB/CheR fusion protein
MKKIKAAVTSDISIPGSAVPTTLTPGLSFPIIGIGASAGGLEAFELFFKTIATDCGMAFVLVPHLDPGHASMLSEILQRNTTMPVHEAKDQTLIQANHVYIIPPNRDMAIFHGTLHLSVPEQARGLRLPIDSFFRSLAEDQGERAICVILSGSGSDGTLGLRAVHGAGGVSFVQEPATAKYDGMPTSAVQSGLATYVLPVEKITEQLVAYVKTIVDTGVPPALPVPAVTSAMTRIMMLLRSKTGNDFSQYKKSTITRRIERRMVVHNLKDMDAYARYLHENSAEVQILFKELLINVTSFFRDKEAFESLTKEVLPRIFEGKPENYIFRVWVPGCASGEEVYSIAMLFSEYMNEIKQEFKIQIYATDIDDDAIATARAGTYPANIAIDVSPERLRRFFAKEVTGFRIKKEIREMVVFAVQNVITDPPFTKMDLISCRNLLIYLEAELQNRVIPAFNYALRLGGVLFLSPSEGIGNFTDLFGPLDKKWKIYTVKPSLESARKMVAQRFAWTSDKPGKEPGELAGTRDKTNFAELTKRVLLSSYAPPSVITDESGNIVYVHGDTGKYLQPAQGQISTNVIDMAREGLQLDLRYAVQNAAVQKRLFVVKDLPVRTNGGIHGVDLTVRPLSDPEATRNLLLISFQDAAAPQTEKGIRRKRVTAKGVTKRVEELEQDLAYTKENLQATIEEMQAANEELKSTNEELQSTNEELQSTNEELETSKEELQSVNEEIVTVNSELHGKIELLTDIQNDMKNLLENVKVGTIFLDDHLAIKRFTHEAVKVYRLAPSDIGRPLADIRSNIPNEDLVTDAQGVLDSLIPLEKPVRTTGNEWYIVRIMPYRTYENVIDGVVLTFSEVTALKEVEDEARVARDYAQSIVDTVREPLVVLNGKFEVISASRSFYATFQVKPEETQGQVLYTLGNRQWDIPILHELLETVLPENTSFENFEIEHAFPGIGHRTMLLNARRIPNVAGSTQLILLAIEDITDRKVAEELLFKKSEEVRLALDYAQSIINTVREPLIILNGRFEVISASRAFYDTFGVTPEATQGQVLYTLGNRQWDIPRLHELLENVLPKNRSFENFVVEHAFPGIGLKKMLLNAREIIGHEGAPHLILLAMEVVPLPGDKEEKGKPGRRDGERD